MAERMTDEQKEAYCRERWANLYHSPTQFHEHYRVLGWSIGVGPYVKEEADLWPVLYDFTLAREEEIREREEVIRWLEGSTSNDIIPLYLKERIRDHEEAALAELRKGLRA